MEKKKFEFKASTVDEAVEAALKELNLSAEEVDVEVKSYGGIFNKAAVIVTPKEKKEEPKEEIIEETAQEEAETLDVAVSESASEEAEEEMFFSEEEMEKTTEEVREFVETLVSKLGLVSTVTSKYDKNEISVSINGDDAGQAIGYRGEVLDAIQYFALVIANKGDNSFIRVQVDSANYRKRRKETLTTLAQRLARKAAKTGRKTALEPMNPFERRVIHTALAGDKFVTTESEGEGKYRHIVIIPKERERRDNNRYEGGNRYDNGNRYDGGNRFGGNNRSGNRSGERSYSDRQSSSSSYGNERNSYDRSYSDTNSYSEKEPSYEYGKDNSFTKKGPSKVKSFGYNNKKF